MSSSVSRLRVESSAESIAASSGCVSEETILAFAEGRLAGDALASLHQHLDGCEACQELLLEAVRGSAFAPTNPDDGTPTADWNTTFRRGELVGQRYRIQRFIARGGMGEVYEAFDRDLSENVALKTVASTACDNPNAVRRLKAEVQLARRVSHPNVCRIYDLGSHSMPTSDAQIYFLTMEFVEGRTLGQRLREQGKLSLEDALNIARQLLSGLSAAHEAGILHRDFKSDNVMLRQDAEGKPTAVILDFGLARSVDDRARQSQSNQQVVGTLGYIAPEQLQGKAFTPASDLYSFGVVLYEMLTGERPSAESKLSPHGAEIEAPSRRNADVSPALDALVLGCLRASPAQRFKTSQEVLSLLDRAQRRQSSSLSRRLVHFGVASLFAITALAVVPLQRAHSNRAEVRVSAARPPASNVPRVAPPADSAATTVSAASAASHPNAPVERSSPRPRPRTALPLQAKLEPRPLQAPEPRPSEVEQPSSIAAEPASAPTAKGRWENPFASSEKAPP